MTQNQKTMPPHQHFAMSPGLRALTLLLAATMLAGCAGRVGHRTAAVLGTRPEAAALETDGGGSVPLTAPAAATSDYRLAPRDELVFEMFNEPAVRTTQRLTTNGEIALPLLGPVHLAGRTLRDAEQLLQQMYEEKGYFVDPQVILSVASYGDRFITVLGQVNSPARIPLPPEVDSLSVVEAITQAGGFTRIARTNAVQVRRAGREGGESRVIALDAHAGPAAGTADQNGDFALLPGDVVFVPERAF